MKEDLQAELIRDLVVESAEGLDDYDRQLLKLESGMQDPDTLPTIFRILHTIKGSSGCVGLSRIQQLAHAGENLLALLRDGKMDVNPQVVDALLSCGDALRDLLTQAGSTGEDTTTRDLSALIASLDRLANREAPIDESFFGLFEEEEPAAEVSMESAPVEPAQVAAAESVAPSAAPASAQGSTDTAIRVDVSQLDRLMNLVGELVLARNQILQHASTSAGSAAQRLNIITTELQEAVMKTRMQPIGNVWNKFPRLVRDVSHELGKEVSLRMEGSTTELDRTILEAIKDPLTHILRNSIDHGIEPAEQRSAAGKPAAGEVALRAYHEGGQVNIEITDDGRGIDRAKLVSKAVNKGLITQSHADRMVDSEVLRLIFHPGLSTAEKVSSISGRGVGMDVVRTNIERIGGSVEVQSLSGRGTSIRIKIPLTLAIIPALVVTCAESRFAIPQANLVELVRIEEADAARLIENVDRFPVYRLRGQLLPLLYLDEALGVRHRDEVRSGSVFIVVVQAGSRQFGLVVDSISDTEEIVVKPLGKELKNLAVYAGATIMGDGRVALILDIFGLARHAHLESGAADEQTSSGTTAALNDAAGEWHSFVLCTAGERKVAILLDSVARLEEFPAAEIESACGFDAVQYRGDILPLVSIRGSLQGGASSRSESVPTVVYRHAGRNWGLVVDRIADIVEEQTAIQHCANRHGVSGTCVIGGKLMDVLDIPAVVSAAMPPEFTLRAGA